MKNQAVILSSKPTAAAATKSHQSCPTLCNPIDSSPPSSAIPGILQARTLEWLTISFSNTWKWKVKVKLLSSVRLSDLMDCSPPGSSVHGIFQARVLEWGAVVFSNLKRYTNLNFHSNIIYNSEDMEVIEVAFINRLKYKENVVRLTDIKNKLLVTSGERK